MSKSSEQIYTPPKSKLEDNQSSQSAVLPSQYPGCTRLQYFGIVFGTIIGLKILGFLVGVATPYGDTSWLFVVGIGVHMLVIAPATFLRFKNIGSSEGTCWTMTICSVIPVVALVATIPGFTSPTGYADHKKRDLASKVVLGFMLSVLVFLAVIFIANA